MKCRFIVNPTAGNGAIRRELPRLSETIRQRGNPFDAVVTKSWSDAREQTRRALHEGYDRVVALGGDGTLNAVINGFFENGRPIREDAALVPSNCGTGCDLYREIAGPDREWTDLIDQGQRRATDVGVIEPLDGGEPHYFLNIASVGISPAIAAGKVQWSLPVRLPPVITYLLPTLRAVACYRAVPLHIRAEGFEFEGDLLNLFVAKGIYCGGGMRFGGEVARDDGRFDITVIGKLNLAEIAVRIPKIYGAGLRNETHERLKVRRFSSPWIEIRSPRRLAIECDGEVRAATDARLKVLPRSVRLCFPNDRAYN